jgi:hypothetical protein
LEWLSAGSVICWAGALTGWWAPHKPLAVQAASAALLIVIGMAVVMREMLR